MARTKDALPRWAKILIAVFIVGVLIWALVPKVIIYISIGIVVVVVGAISYLIIRKRGFQPFKELATKTYGSLKEDTQQTSVEVAKVPSLSGNERAKLIDAVGNKCENPNCREQYPLDVHHIISKAEGGTNKLNNLVVLCKNCHGKAHGGVYSKALLRQWISGQGRRRFRYYVKWDY